MKPIAYDSCPFCAQRIEPRHGRMTCCGVSNPIPRKLRKPVKKSTKKFTKDILEYAWKNYNDEDYSVWRAPASTLFGVTSPSYIFGTRDVENSDEDE